MSVLRKKSKKQGKNSKKEENSKPPKSTTSKANDSPEVIIIDSSSDDDFQPSTSKKPKIAKKPKNFWAKHYKGNFIENFSCNHKSYKTYVCKNKKIQSI